MENFAKYKQGIIVGAGHGIGFAVAEQIKRHYPQIQLSTTYRDDERNQNLDAQKLDPLDEMQIANWAKDFDKIDFILSCVGFLGDRPEKSLRNINLEQLTHSFQVNAIHFPLLLKHLYRKLTPGSLVTCLSAMVGSIEDNKLGGWYGYRASKTALNMFIKNISLELKKSIVMAVHPGTTHTDLSKNFVAGVQHEVFSCDQTAKHLIQLWNEAKQAHSGKHFHWRGSVIKP